MVSDLALLFYIVNFAFCGAAFTAFVWYWKSKGESAELYRAITYLFAVNTFEKGVSAFTRLQRGWNDDFYHAIIDSHIWWIREVLVAGVLGMIVFKIYKRIFTNKK